MISDSKWTPSLAMQLFTDAQRAGVRMNIGQTIGFSHNGSLSKQYRI